MDEQRHNNPVFPFSNQNGSDTSNINTALMRQLAGSKQPLTTEEIQEKQALHLAFLQSGGSGGAFTTLLVAGMVMGIYLERKGTEGEQADFNQNRFAEEVTFEESKFPFTNFCGAIAAGKNFSKGDYTASLFTDADLEKTNFKNANCERADFSRANLRGVNFQSANLRGCDFENCDLTGADFRWAIIDGARFPGAVLDNVLR